MLIKSANEIREEFLIFFEARGHRRVKSGSLVPHDDPTLLFTNAGMNQFKDVFLGREKRDYCRAASSQKCLRVSGKHNDLEEVGRTPRHHTFFEMLGNFSFGDYFKKEAIDFAWELCTDVFGLPGERLAASVFESDDEAYDLWKDRIGLPESSIYRLGASENFWSMGDTGPCGPCSEIHYDMGTGGSAAENDGEPDPARFLEVWNLVFMQFEKDKEGRQSPLSSPSIDTGLGLERVACVLQGVQSNYDTDLFVPIIGEASRLTDVAYGEDDGSDVSLRILADHSRACAFLISDGVVPSNEGRGYVLRKILRRAIRHGKMLGTSEPFLFTLVALVADLMKGAYPELESSREYTSRLVKAEEEKFSSTLSSGLQLLEEMFETSQKKDSRELPGSQLFRLYDTYGFPLDLAREIAEDRGFRVDENGFFQEMEKQRKRARASWKGAEKAVSPAYQELAQDVGAIEFTGYTELEGVEGRITAVLQDGEPRDRLNAGEAGEVLLDRTPFYAEAGGQSGDTGSMETEDARLQVTDTYRPLQGLHIHRVQVQRGSFSVGDEVRSSVDLERRCHTARNHTATHLLHAALRDILGEHVKQSGSLVAPDRLRFDFSHFQPVSSREIRMIEEMVNAKIRDNIELEISVRDLGAALEAGAMALFGEKYGDQVRTVSIPGFSLELCGGSHVAATGEIALFKLIHESSISAGVRRVEAVTGHGATQRFLQSEGALDRLSADLKVGRDSVEETVHRLSDQLRETQKKLEQLQFRLAREQTGDVVAEARDIGGVKVLVKRVEDLDRAGLRSLAEELKNKLHSGVVVLGAPINGKVSLVAMVSSDLTGRVKANELVSRLARTVRGGGGGRPDMAEAGGSDSSQLDVALEQAYAEVEAILK